MPLCTMVAIVCDTNGDCLLLLSDLADHTRAVKLQPRASLLLAAGSDDFPGDALDRPRLTIRGSVEALALDDTGYERSRQRFLSLKPEASLYAGFADFRLYRLRIATGLFNGGFARATRLDRSDLCCEAPDDFTLDERHVIDDLNASFSSVISNILASIDHQAHGRGRVVAIDPWGVDVEVDGQLVRINLSKPVTNSAELIQAFENKGMG